MQQSLQRLLGGPGGGTLALLAVSIVIAIATIGVEAAGSAGRGIPALSIGPHILTWFALMRILVLVRTIQPPSADED